MALLILFGYLSGIITVLSPCILPILPIMLSGVVGTRSRPYGIILGFTISFAVFTLFLSAIVNSLGFNLDTLRTAAAIILVILGLFMFFPNLQYKILSLIPSYQPKQTNPGFWGGILTGVALGLIWIPCAGPILAAVITVAATTGANFQSLLIILAYALGTSTLMMLIILGSKNLINRLRGLDLARVHKIFGIIIILTGVAIYAGYDRKIQTFLLDITPTQYYKFIQSFEETEAIKQRLEQQLK